MILPLDHVLKCDWEMIKGDDIVVSEWWMMMIIWLVWNGPEDPE